MSAVHKPSPTTSDAEYEARLERAAAFGMHKPDPVPPDQAWFWTPEWLAGTIEALENHAAGQVYSQDSDEEFFAFLDEHAAKADTSTLRRYDHAHSRRTEGPNYDPSRSSPGCQDRTRSRI